jgi:hypothetical protein
MAGVCHFHQPLRPALTLPSGQSQHEVQGRRFLPVGMEGVVVNAEGWESRLDEGWRYLTHDARSSRRIRRNLDASDAAFVQGPHGISPRRLCAL